MAECSPSKCRAISSDSSIEKKKRNVRGKCILQPQCMLCGFGTRKEWCQSSGFASDVMADASSSGPGQSSRSPHSQWFGCRDGGLGPIQPTGVLPMITSPSALGKPRRNFTWKIHSQSSGFQAEKEIQAPGLSRDIWQSRDAIVSTLVFGSQVQAAFSRCVPCTGSATCLLQLRSLQPLLGCHLSVTCEGVWVEHLSLHSLIPMVLPTEAHSSIP